MIDYDDGIENLEPYKFCLLSELGNSETDVTHDTLFFECNSITKFISPYQNIAWSIALFCKRVTKKPVASQILVKLSL